MQNANGTYTGDGVAGRRIVTGLSGLIGGGWVWQSGVLTTVFSGGGENGFVDGSTAIPNPLVPSGPDFLVDGTLNNIGVDYFWNAWSK